MTDAMAKVLAETWEAHLHGNACDCPSEITTDAPVSLEEDRTIFRSNDGGRAYSQHNRLRLAACAPEMARMLLGHEWGQKDYMDGMRVGDAESCCPWCGRIEGGDHTDDCAWLAIMRKAGVR